MVDIYDWVARKIGFNTGLLDAPKALDVGEVVTVQDEVMSRVQAYLDPSVATIDQIASDLTTLASTLAGKPDITDITEALPGITDIYDALLDPAANDLKALLLRIVTYLLEGMT